MVYKLRGAWQREPWTNSVHCNVQQTGLPQCKIRLPLICLSIYIWKPQILIQKGVRYCNKSSLIHSNSSVWPVFQWSQVNRKEPKRSLTAGLVLKVVSQLTCYTVTDETKKPLLYLMTGAVRKTISTFPYVWSLNSKMLILQPRLQIHPQKLTRVSANKDGCRFVQGNTRVDWKQHQIRPNQFGFLGVKKIPKAKWSQTPCRSLPGSGARTYYQEL